MSSNAAGFARRAAGPNGQWERSAPWVAPLLTAGVLALATFLMFVSCGAPLI